MSTAKKRGYKNHLTIPHVEAFIGSISKSLSKSKPLIINYTYSGGANYRVCEKGKKNKSDIINIPCLKRFRDRKYFYKTLFHELSHCIMCRIKWDDVIGNSDDEEVIVEFCSTIICFLLGLNTWEESYKYINDYITNYKGQLVHLGRQKYIVLGINKVLCRVFLLK